MKKIFKNIIQFAAILTTLVFSAAVYAGSSAIFQPEVYRCTGTAFPSPGDPLDIHENGA